MGPNVMGPMGQVRDRVRARSGTRSGPQPRQGPGQRSGTGTGRVRDRDWTGPGQGLDVWKGRREKEGKEKAGRDKECKI